MFCYDSLLWKEKQNKAEKVEPQPQPLRLQVQRQCDEHETNERHDQDDVGIGGAENHASILATTYWSVCLNVASSASDLKTDPSLSLTRSRCPRLCLAPSQWRTPPPRSSSPERDQETATDKVGLERTSHYMCITACADKWRPFWVSKKGL